MVADSEQKGLQEIMDRLVEVERKYDMKINVKKTKTTRISRRDGSVVNIVIEGKNVDQVKKFRYLGAMEIKKQELVWRKMHLIREENY